MQIERIRSFNDMMKSFIELMPELEAIYLQWTRFP